MPQARSAAALLLLPFLGLAGCVGAPTISFDAPAWVTRGSGVFQDARGGKEIYGVGSIAGVRNRALAVAAADERALAEVARTVTSLVVALHRDYQASSSAGEFNEQAVRQGLTSFTKTLITNSVIVDHWKSPADGTLYSLVKMDTAQLPEVAARTKNFDPALREFVIAGAAKALGNIAVEGPQASVSAIAQVPPSAAPAPAAATAAGGIDKDEMRRMMEEVLRNMAQQKTDTPKPAAPAVSSDVDVPKYRVPENPDNFAIVMGVEKYSGLPDAQFAERDALAVRDHLIALGYPPRNVVLLTGQKASRSGLVKNLEAWLLRNVNEKSTVFFYYSGHGAPDPKTELAYLVPVDGDPQYLEETAYPVKRLYEKLNALKARNVLVALDSCFSGAGGRSVLAKGTRPLVHKVDIGIEGLGKVVSLSASAAVETSGTFDEHGHGLFTYYLLKGLNGAAAGSDGHVSVKGLYDYLSPKVRDEAQRQNRDQAPQLLPAGANAHSALLLR